MERKWIAAVLVLILAQTIQVAGADRTSGSGEGSVPVSIQSQDALAFLKLDIENNPGWVATIKGGYQWKLFKNVGYTISDATVGNSSKQGGHTNGGLAGSVGLGYNFGPRLPLTLGLNFGLGPGGNLNTRSNFSNGGNDYAMSARQKIRSYTLDASIDYDFRNCSRWTPFAGLTGGVAFISNRGKATLSDLTSGTDYYGSYGKKTRTNLVGGFRAGTKYEVNERVTLSLYGSYTYLGKIPGRNFNMNDGAGMFVDGRSTKVKAHEIDVKVGLKIKF